MNKRQVIKALGIFATSGLLASAAWADTYPTREVTLTVSYAPGGVTDLIGRAIARRMEKELGGPVVVKNVAGAQGTLGQDTVRRSKPDGYNLAVVTSSSTALSPYLVNNVYKPADFDYVGAVGLLRFALVVKADSPYKDIKDFVEAGKSKPIFFGTSSAVTSMGFGELAKKSSAKFEAVNYKSGPEIVTALIGGQVAAIMQAPSEVLPHVQSGRVRILAAMGPTRWPSTPNVPTLREAGYDVVLESFVGLAAPKGMPPEVMGKLQEALKHVSANPGMVAELDALGVEAISMSGAEFSQKLQAAYVAAEPVMKALMAK